jgi:tetratricopeptide (TPR) repeat protein
MKLALLALMVLSLFTVPQAQNGDVLPSPRKGLVAVHWPDLAKLEASVREQVTALQTSLVATAKDPKTTDAVFSEAYGNLGELYHAYSLNSAARECYLNAATLSPKDFRWVYLLGRLDQQDGRFESAIGRYQFARTLRPDYLALPVNLGNIFLELNRLDEATENFKAALAIDADNPATHYGLGQVAMALRNYAGAVKHFEKTLAQVPGATRVHYSLAMAYRGLGDAAKAKEHLAQQGTVGVRVADPLLDGLQELVQGERLFLSRGKLAFEARRYAEAAEEFRKAVAAKPDSITARVNLGAALTQLGDLNSAADQFAEAVRLEPGKAIAHYNLAVILARQNKHDESISHLRSVLNSDANDLSARFLLAQELAKSGRADEALAEFARVVQADAGNEAALLEQVKLLYRKREYKQALDAVETGHAKFPQKGRTVLLLAYVLATSPDFESRNGARALELAQSVYKATGSVEHRALVALALAESGRCNEADEWQLQAIGHAEQQGSTQLLPKLKADRKLYEDMKSCRPPGDASLTNLSFFEIR